MPTFRSLLSSFALLLTAASCSGGTAAIPQTPPGSLPACNAGTQVQLAMPASGSQGNSSGPGFVQIVVDASTNVLADTWNVQLLDYAGNLAQGGTLVPASTPGGSKPFPTNFYYNSPTPPLFVNDVYKVFVNKFTSDCQPLLVGAFST
jgi:hypothetical protein